MAVYPVALSILLKHDLQPELNIPWVVGLRLNLPESRIGQVRHRRAEHRAIERIGKFRAELDLHPLPDGGVLQDGECLRLARRRPQIDIPRSVSKRKRSRRNESRRVDPPVAAGIETP